MPAPVPANLQPFRAVRPTLAAIGLLALFAVAPAHAQNAFGESFGGLQVQGDQPIAIESDQLDVDDGQAVATFSGNVSVQQGETLMRAARLIVHYARGGGEAGGAEPAAARSNVPGGSGEIERIEAEGSVYIQSQEQVATAQNASFDMATQVVVMRGDVVLTQGENVATGCVLTIQMDTGVARLQSNDCGGAAGGGGRVRMLLTPGSQNAPTPR